MNIGVCVSFWITVLSGYVPRGGIAGSCGNSIFFFSWKFVFIYLSVFYFTILYWFCHLFCLLAIPVYIQMVGYFCLLLFLFLYFPTVLHWTYILGLDFKLEELDVYWIRILVKCWVAEYHYRMDFWDTK